MMKRGEGAAKRENGENGNVAALGVAAMAAS
jgi:hypothetical protein